MQIIKERQVVQDSWSLLSDTDEIPSAGDVIVPLARWNAEAAQLAKRQGKTGIVLTSDQLPEEIQQLASLPLVAIEFPKFVDGRGYSSARLLRERLGFKGDIRAVGAVLRDQLSYMERCGFSSYALVDGKDIQGALDAFTEFDFAYQGDASDARPLFRRVARGS